MEKPKSYYDWQQSLRPKRKHNEELSGKKINSLGIDNAEFKHYLKKWKRKNLQ